MKADMHRETARKYVAGKLPLEMTVVRDWRMRPEPFEDHWPEIEVQLRDMPAIPESSVEADRDSLAIGLVSMSATGHEHGGRPAIALEHVAGPAWPWASRKWLVWGIYGCLGCLA
jgi:hypothetical protein